MSPTIHPARPFSLAPATAPRASAPAAPSSAAHTPAPYPGYPTYPTYPGTPGPSLGHGLSLVFQGLGEVLVVTARGAVTLLQWAGTAVVAVLGVAWEIVAGVGKALGRGLRAIFDPGYAPGQPYPGYPTYPGTPGYPGQPYPGYPGYPTPRR